MIGPFSGKYFCLSNFFMKSFEYNGVKYQSNEHFYQAHKSVELAGRVWINQAETAGDSKRRGRARNQFTMMPNWDLYLAEQTMRLGLQLKFTQNPTLAEVLISTDDEELVEVNTWGDAIWGKVNMSDTEIRLVGQNKLGIALMDLRATLQVGAGAAAFVKP